MSPKAKQPLNPKSLTPELVDLKITNFCNQGCSYCYQNSTLKGAHADENNILKIIRALSRLHVFEIAIGGGEPTLYPLIGPTGNKLLHGLTGLSTQIRSLDMVPNFSSRNLDYIKHPENAVDLAKSVGGIAFSISYPEEFRHISNAVAIMKHYCAQYTARTKDYLPDIKISAQYILGHLCDSVGWMETLFTNAAVLNIPITLLGHKAVGRGKDYKVHEDTSYWITALENVKNRGLYPIIGVDTCVAQKHEAAFIDLGISRMLYLTEEGKCSCYIDAVEGFMARSSYDTGSKDRLDLTLSDEKLAAQIDTIFKGY